jgi:hypothetical protein
MQFGRTYLSTKLHGITSQVIIILILTMRSEVLTLINIKIVVLWDVMLCSLVDGHQYSEEPPS